VYEPVSSCDWRLLFVDESSCEPRRTWSWRESLVKENFEDLVEGEEEKVVSLPVVLPESSRVGSGLNALLLHERNGRFGR
jgi:hypothetical protein